MRSLALLLFLGVSEAPQEVPPRVAEEIRKLRSDDFAVRAEAERRLAEFGKEALPALEGLLKDPDADVRSHAKTILVEIERVLRVRAIREPRKRTTVTVADARLDEGFRQVFEPFGIKAVVSQTQQDLKLTLRLENATFWEAWEGVFDATRLMAGNVSTRPADDTTHELEFNGPWLREVDSLRGRSATIGDYRILASPSLITPRTGPARVSVMLLLYCPSWAVPKKARIAGVTLGGIKIASRDLGEDEPTRIKGPVPSGCIRRLLQWAGEDSIPWPPRTGDRSVKVAGTLVLTEALPTGDQESGLPFEIGALPVPQE